MAWWILEQEISGRLRTIDYVRTIVVFKYKYSMYKTLFPVLLKISISI